MPPSVEDIDMGYKKFMATMADMAGEVGVDVGILQKDGSANYDEGDATLAQVATYNEFGSKDGKHPPERSFLRSTADTNRTKYADRIQKSVEAAVDGKLHIERGLGLVGEMAKNDVVRTIDTLKDPPNAASTVARKGANNPLVDTGRLKRSISYQVVKGGSK